MFAIFNFGGKQYKVTADSIINLPHKNKDLPSTIWMTKVLIIANKKHTIIGRPTIKDALVSAKVVQKPKGTILHIQQIHL